MKQSTFDELLGLFPTLNIIPRPEIETIFTESGARIVEDEPKEFLVRKGLPVDAMSFLLSGWVQRYVVVADGRRQILRMKMPGSVISPHALYSPTLPFSVQTITKTRRIAVDIEPFRDALAESLDATKAFQAIIYLDLAIAEDKLVGLGRRAANQKISRGLLKMYARLRAAGETEGLSFEFPLRQTHIADLTGLTPVHVNRVLGQLRADNIVIVDTGMMEIRDLDALLALADLSRDDLDRMSQIPETVMRSIRNDRMKIAS